MLTKTKIALSALLVVGFASAALANEPVENRIGDKYPLLEQAYQQQDGTSAYAMATAQHSVKPYTVQEKALLDRETATHGTY
jgi:hypothetical protein